MSDFCTLAQQAEAAPEQTDFAALRAAYHQSQVYRPAKHIPQSKLMQITDTASGFEQVVETCQKILQANPMDLEARMLLGLAQSRSGDVAGAKQTRLFADRMIDAILATGDGKSFATAWQVLAETEPWTLMKVFEMKPTSHTRHEQDGKIFDVYEGKIEDRQVTMYFDMTIPLSHIENMIEGE